MFKRDIPINIAGPSYQAQSRRLASQQTVNFYPQLVEEGRDNFVLQSWYGLNPLTLLQGEDRGATVMSGVVYHVRGNTLYSVSSGFVYTPLGTIIGDSRCIFADDGINLVVVAPSQSVYVWDGSSLSVVTDSNIVGSTAVTYLNNQMIYTKAPLFIVSDVGDPSSASGLNAASADSQPDRLVRAFAFQQNVFMIGEGSIEPWWNTGDGNPPLARLDGQIINVGCSAVNSVASNDDAFYWLGDDRSVWRFANGAAQNVSSVAMSKAISSYSLVSDAIGYTLTKDGQNFYVITFPSQDKTWAISESLGNKGWFELSSGTDGGKYQATSCVNAYGEYLAFDDSGIYKLDSNHFKNNNNLIQRRRAMGAISSAPFGKRGVMVQLSKIKVHMEKGVGLISGQGEDPKIILEMSYDGGNSWKDYGFARIGRMGDWDIQVEFDILDTFYEAIPRITTSDPVYYSIHSASIDLRLAGR